MLRKPFTALLLSTCIIVAADQAPLQDSAMALKKIGSSQLSVRNIVEEIILDSRVENFTLYGLDGLASLIQSLSTFDLESSKTFEPYVLFDLLDGNNIPKSVTKLPNFPKELDKDSVLQIFIFFAEAFGKEVDPVYFYAVRPRIEGDVFKTSEEIQSILDTFRGEEAKLRSKFIDMPNIFSFNPHQHNFTSQVFSSYAEGTKFFADFGQIHAQYDYANMLFLGIGIEKNIPEAIRYYEMADARGHKTAKKKMLTELYDYANKLYAGHDVEMNIKESVRYFELAAEKGFEEAIEDLPLAYFNYADMLFFGENVEQNIPEAIRYFKMAADKNFQDAEENFLAACNKYALMLATGDGVEQNLLEAARYFKMAGDE